jgi:hypothetical protein
LKPASQAGAPPTPGVRGLGCPAIQERGFETRDVLTFYETHEVKGSQCLLFTVIP